MLMFIWMCVIASMTPAGAQMASMQAAAYQAHLRAQLELPAPEPVALGAARHIARYAAPALAR